MLVGLGFESDLLGPSLILGASQAGLYGLLAVALVLTFRVSRTVGFLHGGLAVVGSLGYWILTYNPDSPVPGWRPGWPGLVALGLLTLLGLGIGALYGAAVMGRRMSSLPRVTLTTFSLGLMLVLAGIMTSFFYVQPDAVPPSPFGSSQYWIMGWFISAHRLWTVVVVVAVVGLLAVVLNRTRAGLEVRAMADDVEASEWAGIRLHLVGTGVYALSGAIATLAGALLTPMVGPDPFSLFIVFLRALTVAVVGGFNSLALALVGSVVLGVVDSSLRTGLFGGVSLGQREMVIMTVIFLAVLAIRKRFPVLDVVDEAA